MKTKDVRAMGLEEMKGKEAELSRNLFSLKIQHATGQLENPLKLRVIRKDIARLKTIIAEKERG